MRNSSVTRAGLQSVYAPLRSRSSRGKAISQTPASRQPRRRVETGRARKTEPPGAAKGGNYERDLRDLLGGIGTPKPALFKPDPFQLEALAALEFEDVLVTAPTGSGKTWIAREEIRRLLEAGKRAWYTTPLKALTNRSTRSSAKSSAQSASEFSLAIAKKTLTRRSSWHDGNFRNQLFDALRGGEDVRVDLVIF